MFKLQDDNGIYCVSALARFCILSVVFFLFAGLYCVTSSAQAVSFESTAATKFLIVKLAKELTADEQATVIARNGGVDKLCTPANQVHIVEVPAADLAATVANYLTDAQVAGVEIK
jgi:hypothetical protein